MAPRFDDIDKRILYYLAADARNTSAPTIADEVNVSAGTIRNRITQLERAGVIRGYHADIDYERVEGRMTNLFECSADVPDRERLAKQILEIPGVIHVQELMSGRGNLQVKAVGSDMADLSRISRELAGHGLEIEEETLVQREHFRPYSEFGPDEERSHSPMTNFMSLSGGAEVVELPIAMESPLAGKTLQEAGAQGIIDEDILIVAIERDDAVLTPKGQTRIQPDDIVTVFSRRGLSDETINKIAGQEIKAH